MKVLPVNRIVPPIFLTLVAASPAHLLTNRHGERLRQSPAEPARGGT
jgi:hypothetical protein